MAVPDSLTTWREFVAYSPDEPDRHSAKRIASLPADAKERYEPPWV